MEWQIRLAAAIAIAPVQGRPFQNQRVRSQAEQMAFVVKVGDISVSGASRVGKAALARLDSGSASETWLADCAPDFSRL